MRRSHLEAVWVAATVLSWAGCCTNSGTVAPYVAVREAQFRSEQSQNDRIKLPLSPDDRKRLLQFLRTGGNKQLGGKGIVDPGADKRYAGLLDFLSEARKLGDLSVGGAKYFTVGPLCEVVDAREPNALSDTQVVAIGDGYYWWIFYHPRSEDLESLLVTRVVGAKPQEN